MKITETQIAIIDCIFREAGNNIAKSLEQYRVAMLDSIKEVGEGYRDDDFFRTLAIGAVIRDVRQLIDSAETEENLLFEAKSILEDHETQ